MHRRDNVIPLEALVDDVNRPSNGSSSDPRRLLETADVVYAVNGGDQRDILIYGKDKLRRMAESDIPEGACVLRVRLRSGPKEMEHLLELVRQSKGRLDYAESA